MIRKNPAQPQVPRRRHGDDLPAKPTSSSGEAARMLAMRQRPRYAGADKAAPAQEPGRGDAQPTGRAKPPFLRPRLPRPARDRAGAEFEPMLAAPRAEGRGAGWVDVAAAAGQAGTVQVAGSAGPQNAAYVRLRILLQDDTLTVLDGHLVDGPLREGASFPGRFAYDVTAGGELVHAGPVPDLGVRRSFVDPAGGSGERFHHIGEVSTATFTVRIPAEALTPARLGALQVRLFRLKDEASAQRLTREPLDRRFPLQARLVASRTGLPRSVLPSEIRRRTRAGGPGAPAS